MARLRTDLPPRLAQLLTDDVLGSRDNNASLALEDAESLLFAIDSALGGGTGSTLEEAGRVLAARIISEGGGAIASGGLMATMSRLGAALEPPFQSVRLIFAVEPNQDGFTLTVG